MCSIKVLLFACKIMSIRHKNMLQKVLEASSRPFSLQLKTSNQFPAHMLLSACIFLFILIQLTWNIQGTKTLHKGQYKRSPPCYQLSVPWLVCISSDHWARGVIYRQVSRPSKGKRRSTNKHVRTHSYLRAKSSIVNPVTVFGLWEEATKPRWTNKRCEAFYRRSVSIRSHRQLHFYFLFSVKTLVRHTLISAQ